MITIIMEVKRILIIVGAIVDQVVIMVVIQKQLKRKLKEAVQPIMPRWLLE